MWDFYFLRFQGCYFSFMYHLKRVNRIKNNTMKILIEIDCETIGEFYGHLSEMRRQIKATCKKKKLNPATDEFKPKHSNSLCDANCYGEHYVRIKE